MKKMITTKKENKKAMYISRKTIIESMSQVKSLYTLFKEIPELLTATYFDANKQVSIYQEKSNGEYICNSMMVEDVLASCIVYKDHGIDGYCFFSGIGYIITESGAKKQIIQLRQNEENGIQDFMRNYPEIIKRYQDALDGVKPILI